MGGSIELARVRGVRITAHWSLLVFGALLTVTLATNLLPEASTGVADWIGGLGGAVLFFASILAHEMSHAVVAQSAGLRVEQITLWMFGGIAHLRDEPLNPRAELRIALAGPAMSLAAGLLFLVTAFATDAAGVPDVVPAVLLWLALVNGVLAVFNMLPGAPLDGGRVLSAVLWMRTGSRARGQLGAARAGRVLGFGLVGLGVANLVFGVGFGSIWTALIGLFIVQASAVEAELARTRDRIGARRVAEVMTTDPPVVAETLSVSDALASDALADRATALLLDEHGGVCGLVTRSALEATPAAQRPFTTLRAVGVAKGKLATVAPADTVDAALGRDAEANPVVVLDGTKVVGIVGARELRSALEGPPVPS